MRTGYATSHFIASQDIDFTYGLRREFYVKSQSGGRKPRHDISCSSERLEVVVDGYVLDLTDFIDHHPGTKAKILAKRARGKDITHNFLDHFGHTTATFRAAARAFDNKGTPVSFTFRERPNAPVRILERLPK